MPSGLPTRPRNILILFNESPEWPQADKAFSERMNGHLEAALSEKGFKYERLKIYDSLTGLDQYDPDDWLVWNWAEELGGRPWTDALIVDELVARGFAYTGSPAAALSLSCQRFRIKELLETAGLPTLPARVFSKPEQAAQWKAFPAIVKGAHQHGSFGIDNHSVVFDAVELADRIGHMRATMDDDSLVEPFLDTREFHVSILGNEAYQVLPPAEYNYSAFPDIHDRIYMYRWKYEDQSIGYKLIKPTPLAPGTEPKLVSRLGEIALAAYQIIGLEDYGRVDLRLLDDEPQVLDVNPNPDMDVTSALVASAGAAGISYADLVERIILVAAERCSKVRAGG